MELAQSQSLFHGMTRFRDPKCRSPRSYYSLKISTKIAAGLVCIPCAFALCFTLLMYSIMSTSSNNRVMPDEASPSQIKDRLFIMAGDELRGRYSSEGPQPLHHHMSRRLYSRWLDLVARDAASADDDSVCEYQEIEFMQKKVEDEAMMANKRGLFEEIVDFQRRERGHEGESLGELLALPSRWSMRGDKERKEGPKITVILNHYKRKTLCAQLEAFMRQTLPFHALWVVAFGAGPARLGRFRTIVEGYKDPRLSFISSTNYDFRYYGRFQLALQAAGADLVYVADDDMIPGARVLEILAHVAGTERYGNAVLGSIGRVLPFMQADGGFPSYADNASREAGVYVPDPAYGILVDRILQVDFLSSSWFLPSHLLPAMFAEPPFTFRTGEDLHLSYQLQKYRDAPSFVVPVDPADKSTWGDGEHRLAYIEETTWTREDVVRVRDEQWWRTLAQGYVTQWARMQRRRVDVLLYAHTCEDVANLAPLYSELRWTPGKTVVLALTGGSFCACEAAALGLGLDPSVCSERRFHVLDLGARPAGSGGSQYATTQLFQHVLASMKGVFRVHSPALTVTVDGLQQDVREALELAASHHDSNMTVVRLPRNVIPHTLWMASVRREALKSWSKMAISINIITQNRPASLRRLLSSLEAAHYVGDNVVLSFNIDQKVDAETLRMLSSFKWRHGPKLVRRRVIQAGLIRAVTESWYPSSDDDFGLLLEDDVEVSPFFYLWLKYTLLTYHYDPQVSIPELNSIALYTPRLIEILKERPLWNATAFFQSNTPYLHQLPCSWGALFLPKHWREFYTYMGSRYTQDVMNNSVQIPGSMANGWQTSWKRYLIDMMYLRGYVTLYPNFPDQASFSTNHVEPGEHIINRSGASTLQLEHRKQDYEIPLLREDFRALLPGGLGLPEPSALPVLDLFNRPVTFAQLRFNGAGLGRDVLSCSLSQIVTVDHLTGLPLQCSAI